MEVRCRTSIAGMPKVEGYLEKRGKFNLRCMWKKYWFVLDGKSLLYFKSKDSYESLGVCKGMIDFSRVQVIRIPAKLKHGFPFEVVTRSQVIYLSANDCKARDIWIEELRHATRPLQISDPFNSAKVSAPHLSNLFEQGSCDPNGVKGKSAIENIKLAELMKCPEENIPLPEQIKYTEENSTNEESEKKENIAPFNEDDKTHEANIMASENLIPEIISSRVSTGMPVLCENLEKHNSSLTEGALLKLPNKYTNSKCQTMENDGTDDVNDESSYETAEETLETENYFDDKAVRQSYGLPYPREPEYDVLIYHELKSIINCLGTMDVNPSINKLGKSVAVEAMRNFLNETEK